MIPTFDDLPAVGDATVVFVFVGIFCGGGVTFDVYEMSVIVCIWERRNISNDKMWIKNYSRSAWCCGNDLD